MINIPEEIILNITNFLDVKDICRFISLNKYFYNVSKRNSDYITNILIKNSILSYYEFENNNSFRYIKNNNSYVFSFCKKNNIFTSKRDAFIKARKNILNKIM